MGDFAVFKTYVDLDGNLGFDGADEDISEYVISAKLDRSDDVSKDLGYLQLVLNNADGRFTPENPSSPYGSNWTLGRRVKVTATPVEEPIFSEIDSVTIDRMCSTLDGFETDLIHALISNITPEMVANRPTRHVTVEARVITRLLELRDFTTGTLVGKTTGELVNMALDTLGASSPGYWVLGLSRLGVDTRLGGSGAMWRDIDSGQNMLPYCSFDETALDALKKLIQSEYGYLYVRKDGWLIFEERHHRLKDRESRFTFTDAHIASLVTEYDDTQLFNHVEVTVHPRSVGSAGSVVWDGVGDADGQPVGSGESREYYVSFSDPLTGQACEVQDVVDPLASGIDYVANSEADGTGRDMTGTITVTLSTDDTERYTCTVENIGDEGVYITTLQVRATPLVAYDAVTVVEEDEGLIARDLQRHMAVDYSLLSNSLEAEDRAQFLLGLHKEPRMRVKKMSIVGNTQEKALQILHRELGDRITVNSDDYGVSGDFIIRGVSMKPTGELEKLEADFELEAAPQDFWILGVSMLGNDTVLAY